MTAKEGTWSLNFCRASGVGIKMEGLLYLQKYVIGGPEFGIKRRICNRKGKAALPCPCHEQGGLLSTALPTDWC